ncbi:MAG: GNAT family N-acetyltransferase [Anaerolineae bacterium]|nr:GNAT family N-acetyltransferase [Anaerolineae bacterium]
MTDIWTQLARYRQVKVMPDGVRVLLRPMTPDDTEQLGALFERAAPEDLERFRSDPTDRDVVRTWAEELDLSRVFPVMVLVNDRVIGDVTIHFGSKFQRHLGWLRLFLDREYRRRGIGTLMIRAAIDIARRTGLHQLIALVPTDQPQVIKAFENLGFRHEFVHRDYAMLHDGRTLDVADLVLYLVDHSGEF